MSSSSPSVEERQLLVCQKGGATITMTDSPSASSGFVSELSAAAPDDLDHNSAPDCPEEAAHRARYRELLSRARAEDLAAVSDAGCMYRAGFDKSGRAVVVFIGKWFRPGKDFDLQRALLYLIRTVDEAADGEYVVVYFHTRAKKENIPQLWWIKEVYKTLTYKYKKNLKAFYVVHPTVWTRMACWWFSTFTAPAVKHKIHNLYALKELEADLDVRELSLPMFITEQDMTFNGLRYYEP